MFFLMSTAAGSALWVRDIENKRDALRGRHDGMSNEYHDDDNII
jgi:hypothetical protein